MCGRNECIRMTGRHAQREKLTHLTGMCCRMPRTVEETNASHRDVLQGAMHSRSHAEHLCDYQCSACKPESRCNLFSTEGRGNRHYCPPNQDYGQVGGDRLWAHIANDGHYAPLRLAACLQRHCNLACSVRQLAESPCLQPV
jgi:hypothetical protein